MASGLAGHNFLRACPGLCLSSMFSLLCFLREKLPVHVVVDPILSKVLRPHQREVSGVVVVGVVYGGTCDEGAV